jgi:hypothetical protein
MVQVPGRVHPRGGDESMPLRQGFKRRLCNCSAIGILCTVRIFFLIHDFEETGDDERPSTLPQDPRHRVHGTVSDYRNSTEAYFKIDGTSFEVFFKPRVSKRPSFYKSDEGRTKISCLIAFTYDKPMAYDVCKINEASPSKT